MDCVTDFELLTSNPKDFEMLEKPKSININSIASIRADGNGSYSSKGNSSKAYFLDGELCQVAHRDTIGYFINHRASGNSTYSKKYVTSEKVYLLNRHYRYKEDRYTHMIAEVQRSDAPKPLDYYYVLSRWNKKVVECERSQESLQSLHGNSKKIFPGKKYKKIFPEFP